MTRIICFLLICGLVAGCGETPCEPAELRFRLVGFSDAESDTLVLRRFQKNSSTIIDSITSYNNIRYARFGDTLVPEAYSSYLLMQSKYDYQLYFPGAGRLFQITELSEEVSSHKKSGFSDKTGCINPMSSCRVDGNFVNTIQFPNTIYLKK